MAMNALRPSLMIVSLVSKFVVKIMTKVEAIFPLGISTELKSVCTA
jgi:hypothetical protein